MEFLIECMDDLSMEQQKVGFFFWGILILWFNEMTKFLLCFQFQFYYRNLSRQQSQQQAWLQKRRYSNFWMHLYGMYVQIFLVCLAP